MNIYVSHCNSDRKRYTGISILKNTLMFLPGNAINVVNVLQDALLQRKWIFLPA